MTYINKSLLLVIVIIGVYIKASERQQKNHSSDQDSYQRFDSIPLDGSDQDQHNPTNKQKKA